MITTSSLAHDLGSSVFYFHDSTMCQRDALYFRDEKIIMVRYEISDTKKVNAILHAKGHYCLGHNHLGRCCSLYDNNQEAEAEQYVIEQRAIEWLSVYNWMPRPVEIEQFLAYFELRPSSYGVAETAFRRLSWRQAN